jgi:hypothetical protein
MSDGISAAYKQLKEDEQWLRDHGWARKYVRMDMVFWIDPMDDTQCYRLSDALDLQESRERAIQDIMTS